MTPDTTGQTAIANFASRSMIVATACVHFSLIVDIVSEIIDRTISMSCDSGQCS